MAERLVTVEVEGEVGEGQTARDLTRAERRIQDRVNRAMRRLDRELPIVYRAGAPVDTGALARSITSTIAFRGRLVRVAVSADAERDGFDYMPVTRWGHTLPVIRPRRKRYMTVHSRGRYARPVLRRRVRGVQHSVDWVDETTRRDAIPLIEATERSLERDIDTVLIGRR